MYIVKIPQVKGSFYVLIRKPRGKILNQNLKNVIDTVTNISDKFFNKYAEKWNDFKYKFFAYFKLVRSYGRNQYHFLVVRKDYHF